jgi:fructokinase
MKLCAFGELLIDVTPYGVSDKGYPVSEFNPGGAPANVAVACVNLGMQASFIGQVGRDYFGAFLKEVLRDKGVDVEGLLMSEEHLTTLAIVNLDEQGERSFSFYRKQGADVMIEMNDLFRKKIHEADVFHLGSVSMSDEPSRTTSFECLEYAKKQGKIITYDPNLRELLWTDLKEAKKQILRGLPYATIVKLSEEELEFLTGSKDPVDSAQKLCEDYQIPLLLITFGAQGSAYCFKQQYKKVEPFKVQAIDTTGAGDGFFGGFLSQYMRRATLIMDLSPEDIESMLRFANACGAYATQKKGAIGALANLENLVQQFGDIA